MGAYLALPPGRRNLQVAPPRVQLPQAPSPPGHPTTPGALVPGPHPMAAAGAMPVDPNSLVPANPAAALAQPRQLSPLEQFLLTRNPNAV